MVTELIIGTKRVIVTAYCPDDDLGLAACEYALGRIQEQFARPVSPEAFRAWLIEQQPAWAGVFRCLDAGGTLASYPEGSVDPTNMASELHIVEHLRREAAWQRRLG